MEKLSRVTLHRVAELFSDERECVEHYQREARLGHFVVGVPLPDASQATSRQAM